MSRIGVFICHCGENIARTVDVRAGRRRRSGRIPASPTPSDYKYMCSDPGQNLLKKAIEEHNLDRRRRRRLLARACTRRPSATPPTQAGLNPFLCEMANIREHCSWVHEDRDEATAKAIDIVRMMVERVKQNRPLEPITRPGHQARPGHRRRHRRHPGGPRHRRRRPRGHPGRDGSPPSAATWPSSRETFPTLDCSQCIMTPRMVEACQPPQHQPPHLQRGREGRRLHRQLPGHDPQEGPLRRHGPNAPAAASAWPNARRRRSPASSTGTGHAHGHLRPVPPGGAQHPGHRPGELHLLQDRQVRASAQEGVRPRAPIDYDTRTTSS